MRHIIFIFILAAGSIAWAAESPIDKGSMMASGGFSYRNFKERDGTSFILSPSFKYFVYSGFSMGLDLNYNRESYWDGRQVFTTLGIGPSFMYFWNVGKDSAEIKGSTYPYIGLRGHYNHENVRLSQFPDVVEYQNDVGSIFGDIGLMFMVSDHAGLSGEFYYVYQFSQNSFYESWVGLSGGISYFIY